MRFSIFAAPLALILYQIVCAPVHAQFGEELKQGKGVQLGEPRVQKWQVGVKVEAVNGPARGLFLTIPVPTDWPEQSVKVISEDFTRNCGPISSRILDGGVRQMVVQIPQVQAGDEARAIVTFEVSTNVLSAPEDTSIFRIPKRAPRQISKHLGTSPFIDGRHSTVRKKAREILESAEGETDWSKIESIYQWTRQNIRQGGDNNTLRGTLSAIRDGEAIAEDIVGVFIALCRASKVPARMVWVQGHYYAEFYMQDQEGEGYWFPAELIGSANFGGVANPKPILQKGDNIRVPELKDPQRYVAEFLKGKKSGARPKVTFIRELVAN